MRKTSTAIAALLTLWCCSASAQSVLTGRVVDRKGQPVPGARVAAKGGTEQTLTDLDGSFKLETQKPVAIVVVTYAGMLPRETAAHDNMEVRLTAINWWNRPVERAQWVVAPQLALPGGGAAIGLMVGRVKDWGWYVKGVYSKAQSTDGDFTPAADNDATHITPWTTGRDKQSYMAATAGAMRRVTGQLHAYLGAGYVDRTVAWQLADGSWARHTDFSYRGLTLDYGVMLRCGHFTINCGALMSLSGGCNFTANVGVGVSF